MSVPYRPWLCTLDYVRQHRPLAASETRDNDLLVSLIEDVSAAICEQLQRVPMPYVATKTFGPQHLVNSLDLNLRDDLLAVTALTNGSGASITTSYALRPDNVYPKRSIELASSSGNAWAVTYREDRITVAGVWGYVPHYATCWRDSGINIPAGGLTDSATSLALGTGQGASFETGQYLRVTTSGASEVMHVTAIATDTLTLARGELGTTAIAHVSGDDITVYRQLPDLMGAARDSVVYLYLHKDMVGSRVKVYDGGTVTVEDLDPRVQKIIDRHKVKHMPRAV